MENAPEHVGNIGGLSEGGPRDYPLDLSCYQPGVLACTASAILRTLSASLEAFLGQVRVSIESAKRSMRCAKFEFNHQMKAARKERWSGLVQGLGSCLGGACEITGGTLQLKTGENSGLYTVLGRGGASGFQGTGSIWASQHRADQEEERGEASMLRSVQQAEGSLEHRVQTVKEKWMQLCSEMLRIVVAVANVHSGGQ